MESMSPSQAKVESNRLLTADLSVNIDRFEGRPGVLMLAMGCAELGNAFWLMFATGMGLLVSTTQTIVGALIGVGFASQASITW